MNRVLVICSGLPPVNATGVHRTLALLRRLRESGCEVMVLTMKGQVGRDLDPSLLAKMPAGLQVVATDNLDLPALLRGAIDWAKSRRPLNELEESPKQGTVPNGATVPGAAATSRVRGLIDWCSTWLQFPDNRIGWVMTALRRGLGPARRFRPDVIYSSAPMWTAHLLGLVLHRLLGRPWVADCRDPWRGNPYRRFRHAAHDRLDGLLERWMVQRARAVICNTPPVERDFRRRYPSRADAFVTIANGFDGPEVAAVTAKPSLPRNGHCRFVHAGVFYGPRSPEPYFAAMARLKRDDPELTSHLRLVQVGPVTYEKTRPLADMAAAHGVGELLELTGPLGHAQALRAVYEGDVAVAASQDGPNADLQVPRKFYEYYGLGKPILVSGGSCATIQEIASEPKGVWLVPEPTTEALAAAMRQILLAWRRGQLAGPPAGGVDLSEDRMSNELERVLQRACRDGRTRRPPAKRWSFLQAFSRASI